MRLVFWIVVAASLVQIAEAAQLRSAAERHAFVKDAPCPSTGKHRLPCPGHQIDHITPLCAGGPDHRDNMQWLTAEAHKAKTRRDLRFCHTLRLR